MRCFVLGFLAAAAVAQQGKGKAGPAPVVQAPQAALAGQPPHFGAETQEPVTAPRLTNAVTDWINALRLAVDGVPGTSNHHHARYLGLLNEIIFKALSQNTNSALTSDVVTSYAAHQYLSYTFPQAQSGYFDALMNVYAGYYNGTYQYRDALDALVLPIVRRVLVRETGRGMANFVQNYVAPSTIGANRSTLERYQGQYQFTDVPNDKVRVFYRDNSTYINWQERGHFGTIKPYFNSLDSYVQGLRPIVVGTDLYNRNLNESRVLGSNDRSTKDKYNYETPFYWLNDWAQLPVIWTAMARAALPANTSNLETARFFAALGLGIFEATNTCYGMKWGRVGNLSALWRPITAHRSGDTFGHSPLPNWTPQLSTPMHPEYPSGHCSHASAAMEIMRLALGTDNITVVLPTDYSARTPNSIPISNRRFTSLSDVENDVANSRVMGGVHWRSSCDDAFIFSRRAAQAAHAFFYQQ